MARERAVIRYGGGILLVTLAGCPQREPYTGIFDVPVAAAVLQPEIGGPFQEPIGFVANAHGGQIVQLALKQGRVLTDDPTVSFLRTNPIATGGARVLTSVAVTATGVSQVTLWAGDQRFAQLLEVPWLTGAGGQGAPVEPEATFAIDEAGSSAADASLADVSVKTGYTTTETWTISHDGSGWTVEGSRSGREAEAPEEGVPYSTEWRRLNFTIRGRGRAGDVFVVTTDNGLTEHDLGGVPLALSTSADLTRIAAIVHDTALDRPQVRWIDPLAPTDRVEVTLAADAWPHRLAWSEDGVLLVADRDRPAVWEVLPGATGAVEHPMPFPTLDVAALDGEDGRRRLYVVPLDGGSLWVFDRDTDLAIDVNAAIPGDQGMGFRIPVAGIEAMPLPYRMPEYSDDQIRLFDRAVAVSLADSSVVFAHEETGCLVQDNLGPRTLASPSGLGGSLDYESSFEASVPGPATPEVNASGRHFVVNPCAGIATAEDWSLRYDENAQAWRVSGSFSGDQEGLAVEDRIYVTDGGEMWFTIRSGTTPSRDGWTIATSVDDGIATATGDTDGDGIREVAIGVGGDPVYFFYRVGLAGPVGDFEGAGWLPVDVRPLVLLPGASSDEVTRVDPQDPALEVGWN